MSIIQLFEAYQSLSLNEKIDFEKMLDENRTIPEWQREEVIKRLNRWEAGHTIPVSEVEMYKQLGWK